MKKNYFTQSLLAMTAIGLCFAIPAHAEDSAAEKPAITEQDKLSLTESNNTFAAELYGQLKATGGNLFFSPDSVSTALAMAYAGARGNTAGEMATALYFRMDATRIHASAAELRRARAGGSYLSANALWVQKGYELQPAFTDLLKDSYGASAQVADFSNNPASAADAINAWVEGVTQHKITQLVSPDALTADTRLLLTNAVYFKADWKNAFEKQATLQDDFHVSVAEQTQVQMMRRTCTDCAYAENEDYQAVALPYKGDAMEMVVLLPRSMTGLPAFEQSLTPPKLQQVLGELKQGTDVAVSLPRFHIENTYKLKDALTAMGMGSAFEAGKADFRGIAGKADLFISDVVHKTYVDVDETGTEAAAATAVEIGITSLPEQKPVAEFHADRPFLFLLRDAKSGAVYFMGRVVNPSS